MREWWQNQEQSQEPSRDHQGKVSVIAACQSSTAILEPQGPCSELQRSWVCKSLNSTSDTLVWAQVLRQEGVQSGCQRQQYQLDGDKLAFANNAEAAHQKSSPQTLRMLTA